MTSTVEGGTKNSDLHPVVGVPGPATARLVSNADEREHIVLELFIDLPVRYAIAFDSTIRPGVASVAISTSKLTSLSPNGGSDENEDQSRNQDQLASSHPEDLALSKNNFNEIGGDFDQ